MPLFLISYDLDKPGQNYESVHKLLKKLGAKRVLESTWALKSHDTSCEAIGNALRPPNGPLDKNDEFVVVEFDKWATLVSTIDIDKDL